MMNDIREHNRAILRHELRFALRVEGISGDGDVIPNPQDPAEKVEQRMEALKVYGRSPLIYYGDFGAFPDAT